jgi:hypothetical protein
MKAKSRVVAILSSIGLMACASTVAATPASAATANVWLIFGDWHCDQGGHVTGIQTANAIWSTTWDWGDNIVYPQVTLNAKNTFNYYGQGRVLLIAPKVFCEGPILHKSRRAIEL